MAKSTMKRDAGWIPVTERLPETRPFPAWDQYLVCSRRGILSIVPWADGWNCSQDDKGVISREHEFKDVVAWMPLPEPYKVPDNRKEV